MSENRIMTDLTNPETHAGRELEKYSSAFTLSDMEIFIFPELFFPLVVANIMSPLIWKWLDDPWFSDIRKRNFVSKSNRIKQYIIDHFVFNLDLETWGLTDKEREMKRFRDFFDIELLKQSNALFGYEGDKYYFSIDIRRHFGLDKYDSQIIPYWKTETVEAMEAYRHKEHFNTGAGECVSLSALYAAAMFIVGNIPLEKIYLLATPLHSQNFIDEKEGLITNNRRIMTKNMWFNGTSLSEKARRALENEKVTIVSHLSGYIHTVYDKATINPEAYAGFTSRLRGFVSSPLTPAVFINFLRFKSVYKCLFQYNYKRTGSDHYIPLEKLFEYEHSSKYSVNEETREKLLSEVEGEEFFPGPVNDKILLNDVEAFLKKNRDLAFSSLKDKFMRTFTTSHSECLEKMFTDIEAFIITEPRLPTGVRNYVEEKYPEITVEDTREEIIRKVHDAASFSEMARLSLYVYREMNSIDWKPFVKAALERNPVCHEQLKGKNADEIYAAVNMLKNKSIYDNGRMAMPDEVWNFRRGDGSEKAFLMADAILMNDHIALIEILFNEDRVSLSYRGKEYLFSSMKGFSRKIKIKGYRYEVN